MIFIRKNFRSFKKLAAIATFFLPSSLRIPILRFVGFRIGKRVTICPFTIIIADEVEIGNDVYISPLVLIFNLKKVKLGNRAYLSVGTFIHSHGLGSLEMGDFSATGLFCIIDCTCDVTIGKYSCLGPRCMLSTHGSFLPKSHGFSNRYYPVKIGNYVWLMMDVKVTSGVTIGDYVIAHAGTVITTNIADNSVYTHGRENFHAFPMSSIYRKTVNDEYFNRWRATLFSDLPSFIMDYFGMKIDCVAKDGCWVVNTLKEEIKIWDKDIIRDFENVKFGRHDIVIILRDSDPKIAQSFRNINWLDANLNLYNRAEPSLLFDYIVFYFEMRYGINFTLCEV